MNQPGLTPIDDYITRQPEKYRAALEELRSIVKSLVPDAEELFSYQVGCFKHHQMLVGIGVTKEFCSLYTMSPPLVKQMKEELKGMKVSGATIHFPPNEALPAELIRKIVIARIRENEERVKAKKK
jgi:uncharacterized protein YdhG (YjbR/CyaY superfamily)